MAEKNRFVELNNGVKMPLMGYGTFLAPEGESLHDSIVYAIVECGYRHIDTAALYQNEKVIGDALKVCFEKGIKREDLFITTKLWRTDYDNVEDALKASLEKLQLEFVDLYLIHWTCPVIDFDNAKVTGPSLHTVWEQMEKANEAGLAKSIGVSNCTVALYIDLLASAKVTPVINQIENNPYLAQTGHVEFLKKFGTITTAYAPIGASGFTGGNLLEDETLKAVAEKHSASPAQISLAWNMNRGVTVIPKSLTESRIKENFEALDIKLDEDDISKLNALDKNNRTFNPKGWNSPEYCWKFTPYFE